MSPILPAPAGTPLAYTVNDIIVDALIETGIIAPGDEDNVPDSTAQWAFRKINYLMDNWAAMRAYVYTDVFQVFTLQANLAPHTIGPTGTFVVAQRPVKILSAALLLNGSTTEVDSPISVRDSAWWAAQQTKSIPSSVPTDLYYSEAWENGELNFWPVPNAARNVRLQMWQALTQFTAITDEIGGAGGPSTLPQGYRAAMMLTLAETLLPGSATELHPALAASAKDARKAVFGNNIKSPRIATRDFGVPRSGKGGQFNWGTGGPPGQGPR